jgi:hypothetical protein
MRSSDLGARVRCGTGRGSRGKLVGGLTSGREARWRSDFWHVVENSGLWVFKLWRPYGASLVAGGSSSDLACHQVAPRVCGSVRRHSIVANRATTGGKLVTLTCAAYGSATQARRREKQQWRARGSGAHPL